VTEIGCKKLRTQPTMVKGPSLLLSMDTANLIGGFD